MDTLGGSTCEATGRRTRPFLLLGFRESLRHTQALNLDSQRSVPESSPLPLLFFSFFSWRWIVVVEISTIEAASKQARERGHHFRNEGKGIEKIVTAIEEQNSVTSKQLPVCEITSRTRPLKYILACPVCRHPSCWTIAYNTRSANTTTHCCLPRSIRILAQLYGKE